MTKAVLTLAVLILTTAPTLAHDYWLEPDTFFPAVGDRINVRLYVGERLTSEAERPFQKKPTVRFQWLSAQEVHDLAAEGEDGKAPAARVRPKKAGNYLIALERAPQTIKLEADKFNAYLAEEGLEAIVAERKKAGEEKAVGRERYTRYLKSLLQAGDRHDDTCQRVLGQRLEIVPQANPYELKRGESLTVRVLFDGKPLSGARVFAVSRSREKTDTQMAVTSKEGTAAFKLDRPGVWLIRLVHMRRCTGDADVDWESFWAACSFGVKG